MIFIRSLLLWAALSFFTACSTTNQRIQRNTPAFNNSTPTEQAMIKAGEIAVGFSQEQVELALGKPDREISIETKTGKQLAWEYRDLDPNLGLSLGLGTRGRGVSTGVGVSSRPLNSALRIRVIFDRQTGNVSKIEKFK